VTTQARALEGLIFVTSHADAGDLGKRWCAICLW